MVKGELHPSVGLPHKLKTHESHLIAPVGRRGGSHWGRPQSAPPQQRDLPLGRKEASTHEAVLISHFPTCVTMAKLYAQPVTHVRRMWA